MFEIFYNILLIVTTVNVIMCVFGVGFKVGVPIPFLSALFDDVTFKNTYIFTFSLAFQCYHWLSYFNLLS